jgi:hypothetical protein
MAAAAATVARRWQHLPAGCPQVLNRATARASEGSTMSTTKEGFQQSMLARLATAGQKIDAMVAKARYAAENGKARVGGRVDALRAHEASTRTRLRELSEADQAGWQASVMELNLELDELEVELAIVGARLDAELATDDAAFAAAVDAELAAWNTHLEVMQAWAATTKQHARAKREAGIRQVRERRAAAKGKLQAFRKGPSAAVRVERAEVSQAMEDLDRAAEDAAANFD